MVDKAERLLKKLKQSPNNVTFADIRKLLEESGFSLDRVSGSHHMFRRDDIVFAIPVHRNRVKVVYVKRVIEIIENNDRT